MRDKTTDELFADLLVHLRASYPCLDSERYRLELLQNIAERLRVITSAGPLYRLRPLTWNDSAGKWVSQCRTVAGRLHVGYRDGRWGWYCSEVKWTPCGSLEDGKAQAESWYREKQFSYALERATEGISQSEASMYGVGYKACASRADAVADLAVALLAEARSPILKPRCSRCDGTGMRYYEEPVYGGTVGVVCECRDAVEVEE